MNSGKSGPGNQSNPYGSPKSSSTSYNQYPKGAQQDGSDKGDETTYVTTKITRSQSFNINTPPIPKKQVNYGQRYASVDQPGSDKANVAVIFGVLGLLTFWVFSILGTPVLNFSPLVFGILGLVWVKKANKLGHSAIAGRVLSIVNIGLIVLAIGFLILATVITQGINS